MALNLIGSLFLHDAVTASKSAFSRKLFTKFTTCWGEQEAGRQTPFTRERLLFFAIDPLKIKIIFIHFSSQFFLHLHFAPFKIVFFITCESGILDSSECNHAMLALNWFIDFLIPELQAIRKVTKVSCASNEISAWYFCPKVKHCWRKSQTINLNSFDLYLKFTLKRPKFTTR